jgi:CheY-like chemotaxis protein
MEKARILIVDDTYDIVRTLELLLQDRYEVIAAPDGLVGFTRALRYLPDLIVLDIMMPKMTGYQFCDQLKKNPTLYNIPIVF